MSIINDKNEEIGLKQLEEIEENDDTSLDIDDLEDSELKEKLALIDRLAIENKKDKDEMTDDEDDSYIENDDDEYNEDNDEEYNDVDEDNEEGSDF